MRFLRHKLIMENIFAQGAVLDKKVFYLGVRLWIVI